MSNTRLLKSIPSPSKMVRRSERSFRPTSNSSYIQSSAFQTLICWRLSRGVLSGIFQFLLNGCVVGSHARRGLGAYKNFVIDANGASRGVNFHSLAPHDLVHLQHLPRFVSDELCIVKHVRAPYA